jgi:hypothetical protein
MENPGKNNKRRTTEVIILITSVSLILKHNLSSRKIAVVLTQKNEKQKTKKTGTHLSQSLTKNYDRKILFHLTSFILGHVQQHSPLPLHLKLVEKIQQVR